MPDRTIELRGAPWEALKRLNQHRRDVRDGKAKKRIFEILVEGRAGGGKTYGITAGIIWGLAHRYPGIHILVLRCVKADLATTFQKALEEDIIPAGHRSIKKVKDRVSRRAYNCYNGPDRTNPTVGASIIQLGGMEDVQRHRGTNYDIIYFLELVELPDEGEYSEFLRALRSWQAGIPFQLLISDTNPDAPDHWVNLRFPEYGQDHVTEFMGVESVRFRLLSRHEDNPKFYDVRAKKWTEEGAAYMSGLEGLHGVRKERLKDGKWIAAEGVVYGNFDRKKHIAIIPDKSKLGIRYYVAAMDWGYTDPGVILVGGVTGEGRIYVVAEIYRKGDPYSDDGSIKWWSERVVELHKEFQLERIVVDPSRNDVINEFNRVLYGYHAPVAVGANNDRACDGAGDMAGIDGVRAQLADMSDGKPGLIFLSDRLRHGPDPKLQALKKPTDTVMEFGSYVYRKARTAGTTLSNRQKELTDPSCVDHGMDTARYLVSYVRPRFEHPKPPVDPTSIMNPMDKALLAALGRKPQ